MSDVDKMEGKSAFLFDVIKRYDHYIGTTNFKVGLIMSFIVAIVLGLTLRLVSIDIDQVSFNSKLLAVVFGVLTILLSLLAAINLLRTIFPNTNSPADDRSLIFFGDVANSDRGAVGYFEEILEAESMKLLKDVSFQTYTVAQITTEKFRVLKIAVNLVIYGVIPSLAITLLLLIFEGVK